MLVPIRELYGMKAQKAFRFGHSGLIVIIKGYEELFLEFSSSKRRNECMTLLEDRMTAVREAATPQSGTPSVRETKIMEDLDDMLARSAGPSTSLPSPLFNSAASSLLEFKPEPMKIVCLTIGSRGDVQPYIALCKGLQAEGHTPVIASHGEYRDWVEGVSNLVVA
jgi:sterol 3beta-glucosyltransferase